MGTPAKLPAGIVAVRVTRRSRSAVATAGHQQPPAINGEQFLMNWLTEQDEIEKQTVLHRLFIQETTQHLPEHQAAGEKAKA
ncbi:hypothetical protein [Endozoicomonas acroporae]|uniref:hypothetical protein n=1 Tax=Endozoicomonas acroporae TaxID=1701104 RepID=UPI0013D25CED|nr:hypothetical protein [Endozoicomonas acroporae]